MFKVKVRIMVAIDDSHQDLTSFERVISNSIPIMEGKGEGNVHLTLKWIC